MLARRLLRGLVVVCLFEFEGNGNVVDGWMVVDVAHVVHICLRCC